MANTELLDQKIKGVYLKEHPWDPPGEEIIETVTLSRINHFGGLYEY